MRKKEYAKKVAVVMQHSPSSDMTVEQLVMAGRYPYQSKLKGDSEEDIRCVNEAIASTGCDAIRRKRLRQLSGGEIQKAYIAMALAQNTEVIFLDEPTSHLDLRVRFEIMELLLELKAVQNKTLVMILHDLDLALRYSDEAVIVKRGKVVSSGSCEEIRDGGLIQETLGIEMKRFSSEGRSYCCFDRKKR